jgi:hypothetical protein
MPHLTLLIIRHAEKPKRAWPGPGLTPEGAQDDESLVIRGWQRAGSWSALFGAGLGGIDFPRPGKIYAADPNDTTSDLTSHRPFETITPLAAQLSIAPVVKYALGQEADLVAGLLKQTGCALVCWEHKSIVKTLLPLLAGAQSLAGLPTKWDSDRFDVVLRFDRSDPSALWSFRQLFPRLLSGDSDIAMS